MISADQPKILVCDDEPNIVMSLEFLLKKQKYRTFIARNGSEALQIAQKEAPDLIVLDIMMPDVDGYEVCRTIRQNPDLKHTRIVFLSAKSKESDIQIGMDAGADAYLTKPFSTRELLQRIIQLLETPRS